MRGSSRRIHIPSGNETHVQSAEYANQWTKAIDLSINKVADSESDGSSIASSVDGSGNVTLTVPEEMTGFTSIESTTFKGALDGNAKTATALTWDRAFAISSPGNGLNTLTFNNPAFTPFSLKSSTTAFVVPAENAD